MWLWRFPWAPKTQPWPLRSGYAPGRRWAIFTLLPPLIPQLHPWRLGGPTLGGRYPSLGCGARALVLLFWVEVLPTLGRRCTSLGRAASSAATRATRGVPWDEGNHPSPALRQAHLYSLGGGPGEETRPREVAAAAAGDWAGYPSRCGGDGPAAL